MPRAFLITHRRYNGAEEFEDPGRNYSPERAVRIPDYNRGHPTSDGGSECGSETSSECPEELYNLTKLAEVSLAAAAGTLIHPSNVLYQRPISPQCSDFRSGKASHPSEDDESLRSRTKLFFERIESEREAIESHSSGRSPEFLESRETSTGEISPLPHSFHRFHHRYHHHHHLHPHHPHQSLPPGDESEGGFPLRSFSAELKVPPVVPTPVAPARRSQSDKSEDNEDHECPDCGKKYSTSSNLARHRQTHRSLGDKKARRCPHCDKVYVSMPAFSMHVRTHNQGCKCHYCGKCFSRPWLLQGHIRTHTGEKPFKCTICNKAFADKSNLRAHIQTHSNTKPHVCGRCGKAFALKSYLYKHEESSCMRAHHRTSSSGSSSASASTEKCDTSSLQPAKSVVSPMARLPAATASPTSVIVPRLAALNREERSPGSSSSAFSAIIRHTKSSVVRSPSPKRRCLERRESGEDEKEDAEELVDENREKKEYLSSMVIRTSVISPNPEHLTRIGFAANAKKAFDFSDPSRSSAFSRPTGMTLNLAIA